MAFPTRLELKAALLAQTASEIHELAKQEGMPEHLLSKLETSRAAAMMAQRAVLYHVAVSTPCDCRAAELHSPIHSNDCDLLLARRRWQERLEPKT